MAGPAELLLRGGRVWTGIGTTSDAVAVTAGDVVALGRDAVAVLGPRTEVVDLAGGTLLPGFRDGHLHPLAGGAETLDCDLVDSDDVADVLARVERHATSDPTAPWIIGWGYPPELLPGGVGRAELLDAVVPGRPVALWSSDHHMIWCNSRALEVAGITAATPDPPRGTIVRDEVGAPAGTLLEADELLADHVPARDIDTAARGLQVGLARMVRAGLVAGLDAWTTPAQLPAYERVADAGLLTVDLDLAFKVEPDSWREDLAAFVDARAATLAGRERRRVDGVPGGRLTASVAKFFVDGVLEAGTGLLREPYEPGRGGGSCDHGADHGIANWEAAALVEAATALDAAGFQLHCHAIGDAAIGRALDAFAAVAARNGPRDRRPTVAHTHLVHPADVPRFAALGVVANLQPLWAQPNRIVTELTDPRIGPRRSRWQYPIGSLLRAGANVSFGSDWPVSSHEPLAGIAVAVTRQTADGRPPDGWLPDERIGLDAALTAYTAGTAHQMGDEARAGTIEVGRRADLVATAQDLAEVAPRGLGDVEVTGTWLAGRRVHGG
jgi:predicted amidohydrolase YtcJ